MTENMENIIVENAEDVITVIPEEIVPVAKPFTGLKITGAAALTLAVGYGVYKAYKRIVPKIKAKKAAKEENGIDNIVQLETDDVKEVIDDTEI